MTTKKLNIAGRSYYFYNDLIRLWNFDERNLKLDKKSWKDINIYYLGYVDKKPEWNVNSVNQLYLIVNGIYGSISEENGTKYLTISKPENVLKKYEQVFSKIKQKIKKVSGEEVIYNDYFQKIKFSIDDDLPLNELIYFLILTVVIRCVFKQGGIFYPQVCVDGGLYQSYKMDKVKRLFDKLQMDSKSVLFIQEEINDKLFKKLKNSKYKKEKEFVNSFNLLVENKVDFKKRVEYSIPIKTEFVSKSGDIDCSTLFSIQAPFDLMHADVGDLRFLGKRLRFTFTQCKISL